jgi:hypothetical protein
MTDESTATRSYVVLREEKAEGGLGYWLVGQTEAVSAIGAIRNLVEEEGTYVAVPARSFNPLEVKVEKTTTVKIG